MEDKSSIDVKAACSVKKTNLHRSLAIIQDSNPNISKDKGEMSPLNSVLLNEGHLEKNDSQKSLDPTRYGDWESKGRCIDF